MNKKKIIAVMLMIIMIIPSMVWSQELDQDLIKVIGLVKAKIAIPESLTEFSYSMREQSETTKEKIYTLLWQDLEYKIGSLQIEVEQNGNIISYSKNNYKQNSSVLAEVSYEQGLQQAKRFLNQVASHYVNELQLNEERSVTQSNIYRYRFNHVVRGVKVFNEIVSVYVDKQTGEVIQFHGFPTFKGNYDTGKAEINLDKAKAHYLNKIGVSLVYQIRYDYESKTIKSFPIYQVNNAGYKAIGAKTGEIIIPFRENTYIGIGREVVDSKELQSVPSTNLTPQEQKVVDEIKDLITPEKALGLATKHFTKLKGAQIKNAFLYQSIYENQYTWQMNISSADTKEESINLSIDAKTGEVLNYAYYLPFNQEEHTVSETKTREKVEAFLRKIAPEKFAQTSYKEQESYDMPIPMPRPMSLEQSNNPYRSYYYQRIVNGVGVQGDGLKVTYDTINNEVISYSNVWHDTAFKALTKVIDQKKIVDHIGLELMFIDKNENSRVLAYIHEESYMSFDPYTGVKVNAYDGKPLRESVQLAYNDIKGHPYESIIKKLYDSGIYLPGEQFKPDTSINQIDFLRFLLRTTDDYITEDALYKQAIDRGILEEKEKNKNLILTHEEAIKYIINSTPYKKIATHSELYQYPFKNEETATKSLKGAITLAYGLGVIDQTKTDFNPKEQLTRAQSAYMIYHLLVAGE